MRQQHPRDYDAFLIIISESGARRTFGDPLPIEFSRGRREWCIFAEGELPGRGGQRERDDSDG